MSDLLILFGADLARFWDKVDTSGGRADRTACWPWTASLDRQGYGRFNIGGTPQLAYRVAYANVRGPIPDGLTLDHLCRVRACVRPSHLEAVPIGVNVLRGTGPSAQHAAQTHCVNGHAFDASNTYSRSGHRKCRACAAASERRRYERKREDINAALRAKRAAAS